MMSSTLREPDTRTRILATTWRLLEASEGQGVRMEDVATAAGISRQAVYLHFASRTELLVATVRYVDQVQVVEDRLCQWRTEPDPIRQLDGYVEFWGSYLPTIYGLAKALLALCETDEAAAAAWNDRMADLRVGCACVIDALDRDGLLAPAWTRVVATDLFAGLLSVRLWEHLTIECGWSAAEYMARVQMLAKRAFVRGAPEA